MQQHDSRGQNFKKNVTNTKTLISTHCNRLLPSPFYEHTTTQFNK